MKFIIELILINSIIFFVSSCNIFYKKDIDSIKISNVFKYHYNPIIFTKYSGHIYTGTAKEDFYIQNDSIRVYLTGNTKKYKSIFTSGLIYGQLIYCALDTNCKPVEQDIFIHDRNTGKISYEDSYGWTGHSIKIDSIQLLENAHSNPSQRRFKLWVDPNKFKNSYFYNIIFIELTNKKANRSTEFENFVDGACTTFIKNTWQEL
jgi:hypothetical protein